MKATKYLFAILIAILFLSGSPVLAQGNSEDHGHGHDKDKDRDKGDDKHHDDDDHDRADYYHNPHDQDSIRGWRSEHEDRLPPGLAKKDRLPPGLERQLVRRGSLPPGLQRRMYPCPEDLQRRLPPPPPDCAHVLIGGHIVLLNRRTNIVVDVFHFEIQ